MKLHAAQSKVRRDRVPAFTLVEVILAILIISAIMTVLLYFYQRAAEVRQKVIQEAEYLSVSRMFLEQISSELRSARVIEDQFIGLEGSSNSITFICTSIPQTSRWITRTNEAVVLAPATDLKRVTYTLLTGTNLFEAKGLDRSEESLTGAAFTAGTNSTEFLSAGNTNGLTNLPPALSGTNIETNLYTTNDTALARQPLTDRIKYLRFRYWAGTNWVDSWSGVELPAGVEVTIGKDPMPSEPSANGSLSTSSGGESSAFDSGSATASASLTAAEEYPYEFFRRVIYLPGSLPKANGATVPGESDFPDFPF